MFKNFILLCFFLVETFANPHHNYCFNVLGNSVNLSFNQSSFNISSNIFGQQYICDNEHYEMEDNNIMLNTSNSDCLNSVLAEQGACPCPPNLVYDDSKNIIIVTDTDIGNITIKGC
mgnify:CR=1 FL=1